MLWIKVDTVESVDDLKSSRSVSGTPGPNFELLDLEIPSALNRIIQKSRFKKKVNLEEMKVHKEDRFLRGRQIAHLIYEFFRVTGTDDSVENYTDLFTTVHRNGDIQEFGSKWNEIPLSMTHIPSDGILESLYKKLSRLYRNCTIWIFIRRKLDLIITDWRQWWKEISSRICEWRIFQARNENYETSTAVKKQGTKQRG